MEFIFAEGYVPNSQAISVHQRLYALWVHPWFLIFTFSAGFSWCRNPARNRRELPGGQPDNPAFQLPVQSMLFSSLI